MIGIERTCPKCDATVEMAYDPQQGSKAHCLKCGEELVAAPVPIDQGLLQRCPCCGTDELYEQKDFPQRLGVALVAVGGICATIAWYLYLPLLTYGSLFLFFGIDAALFRYCKDVTVCYRCLAQFRARKQFPRGVRREFDLAIGERYRQERLRKEAMKRAAEP